MFNDFIGCFMKIHHHHFEPIWFMRFSLTFLLTSKWSRSKCRFKKDWKFLDYECYNEFDKIC